MHPYATDSEEKKKIPFYLAALAIALSFLIFRLLVWRSISMPWWVEGPSPVVIYFLLSDRFSKTWWRWAWLRRIGVVSIPDLSGNWSGQVHSSYDDFKQPHQADVRIFQTWSEISIKLSSSTSRSHSQIASLLLGSPDGTILSYQYQNEPAPGSKTTMQIHVGTARLVLSTDQTGMEGDYYSGRGRQNYGSIRLEKQT